MVLSPYQNVFFAEIVEVLSEELRIGGVDVVVTTEPGEHQVEPDDVFVLVPPHEYVALEGRGFVDSPDVAARTVGISAEQPHQSFFDRNAEYAAYLGGALDFSALAVDAYQRAGVNAQHLRFGYTARWDRSRGGGGVRSGPPRVLYLGNKRPRRLNRLALAADTLARHEARLLISDNDAPNLSSGPSFVAGEARRDLLAQTRLLINIHQGSEPYFEWLRITEAAHCGTPVLSERSIHTEPFVAGQDFVEFADGTLAGAIEDLIGDDQRLEQLAGSAYQRLRRHPLSETVEVIVDVARRCLPAPPPTTLPGRTRVEPLGLDRTTGRSVRERGVVPVARRRGSLTRRHRRQLTVIGDGAGIADTGLVEMFGFSGVRVISPDVLSRRRVMRIDDGLVLTVPPGCKPRPGPFGQLLELAATYDSDTAAGADPSRPACWTAIIDGLSIDGEPTLEGIWAWEPWRLSAGQHLGRLVLAPAGVFRAAARWFDDPLLRDHPHLVIAAWVAAHGGAGGHLCVPTASVTGTALDPSQRIDQPVARRIVEVMASLQHLAS